jgi:hypothetical protein
MRSSRARRATSRSASVDAGESVEFFVRAASVRSWRSRAARSWVSTKRRRAVSGGGVTPSSAAARSVARRTASWTRLSWAASSMGRASTPLARATSGISESRSSRLASSAGVGAAVRVSASPCRTRSAASAPSASTRSSQRSKSRARASLPIGNQAAFASRVSGPIMRVRGSVACQCGASRSSVTTASARPSARRRGTAALSGIASTAALGKSERATRSRWPPRFTAIRTPGRSSAPRSCPRAVSATRATAPVVVSGSENRPARERVRADRDAGEGELEAPGLESGGQLGPGESDPFDPLSPGARECSGDVGRKARGLGLALGPAAERGIVATRPDPERRRLRRHRIGAARLRRGPWMAGRSGRHTGESCDPQDRDPACDPASPTRPPPLPSG